jgi:hypothetical protein
VIEKKSSVGIKEMNNLNNIQVYPNPCNNKLTIETNSNLNKINYQVYNLSGKLIMTDTFENNNTINTTLLNNEIYYIHFNDGISSVIVKFIKE